MRRSAHSASLAISQTVKSPYICSSCRRRSLLRRHAFPSETRAVSKLTRMIWGPDGPYGPKGDPNVPQQVQSARDTATGEEAGTQAQDQPSLNYYQDTDPYAQGDGPMVTIPDDAIKEDPNYVPAETWEGLQHIGGLKWQGFNPPLPPPPFRPFLGSYTQAKSREQIVSAVHQSTVEVVALFKHDPALLWKIGDISYAEESRPNLEGTAIELDREGNAMGLKSLDGADADIVQAIVAAMDGGRDVGRGETEGLTEGSTEELTEPESEPADEAAPFEARSAEDEWDQEFDDEEDIKPLDLPVYPVQSLAFLNLSLTSSDLRFAITKRLSQLTGHRIPDPVLNSATTLTTLYHHLLSEINPVPKKLAERLLGNPTVAQLPNISVRTRRETKIDEDKRLGRFKVIQAELERRGLPPIGRRRL